MAIVEGPAVSPEGAEGVGGREGGFERGERSGWRLPTSDLGAQFPADTMRDYGRY